jgi:ABC-type polysaccharide/polyol phosphate export permease
MSRGVAATYGWIENRPTQGRRALQLGELWQYREVVAFLALRDLKIRYKQAAFGLSWTVIQPLAGALVFALVFNRLAKVSSGAVPYPAFALLGFGVWTYFSTTLIITTNTFVQNATLITRVYFPRLAAPLASVLPGVVGLVVSLLLLGVFMIGYSIVPGVAILTLPGWILVLVAVTFGVGLFLATLNVKYRDANNAYTLLIQVWLFASPVAYPPNLVHGNWQYLYYLNPMAGILGGFRWALFNTPVSATLVAESLAVGGIVLALALGYFLRVERQFADVI